MPDTQLQPADLQQGHLQQLTSVTAALQVVREVATNIPTFQMSSASMLSVGVSSPMLVRASCKLYPGHRTPIPHTALPILR